MCSVMVECRCVDATKHLDYGEVMARYVSRVAHMAYIRGLVKGLTFRR